MESATVLLLDFEWSSSEIVKENFVVLGLLLTSVFIFIF